MSKKNIIIFKILLCFVISLLIYFIILIKPNSILLFSEKFNEIIYIILLQVILISYVGAICLEDIKKNLFKQPKLVYYFMDILIYQLFIFSIIYLSSNLVFIKYVNFLDENFKKYQLLIQTGIFILLIVVDLIKNKSKGKKNIISFLVVAMIIFNSNIFELIFMFLYIVLLLLLIKVFNNNNIIKYNKLTIIVEIILFFVILLIMVLNGKFSSILLLGEIVIFFMISRILLKDKDYRRVYYE